MDGSRGLRTTHRSELLIFIAIATVGSFAFTTVASARSPSVSAFIKMVRSAIRKEPGAKVLTTAHATSSVSDAKENLLAGATSGEETFSRGGARLAIKVTPSDAYVSGSQSGLTTILGVSATDSKKIGSDWVYWKRGTTQYSDLKLDVTISSLTAVLPNAKHTKLSTHVTHGAAFYVLNWTSAATSSAPKLSNTLTVSMRTKLPFRLKSAASGGTEVATKYSNWGRHVHVSAPPAGSTKPSSKIKG